MNIENEARFRAKEFLLENGISKITLENIVFILEEQGFRFVEYSKNYMECFSKLRKFRGGTNNSKWCC